MFASNWAKELMEIDQSIRTIEIKDEIAKINTEFEQLKLDIKIPEFSTYKIDSNEENYQAKLDLQVRIKRIENIFTQNDAETRNSLEGFMSKIGGFPSMNFGINVLHTAWIIAQHSGDSEFQKKILEEMLITQKNSQNEIPLVYFYYLADRIMSKLGYQFFGTQENCPIRPLPTNFVTNITSPKCSNPYYLVVELTKKELPTNFGKRTNKEDINQNLLKLWEIANRDKTVGGQQEMVKDFLEKYKTLFSN